MKFINTRLHGMLDYIIGATLAAPYIFEYYTNDTQSLVLMTVGGIIVFYSLMTNYEFGLIRLIPLKVHLWLDVIFGLFLIATPWLFPTFTYYMYWPVLMGILSILIVVFTKPLPFVVTPRDLDITKP
jgi:hypothetical protein